MLSNGSVGVAHPLNYASFVGGNLWQLAHLDSLAVHIYRLLLFLSFHRSQKTLLLLSHRVQILITVGVRKTLRLHNLKAW